MRGKRAPFRDSRSVLLPLLVLIVLSFGVRAFAEGLSFSELYKESILGLEFSAKVKSLEGHTVDVVGYMAPPLKVRGNFFVLSREPVSLCPYCNTDADWPADILVVYLKKDEIFRQPNRSIVVTGRLEVGSYTDPDTGFVSLLRLVNATYK